jgi:starch synthase
VIRVAYVASEVYPFSKTGGLADVAHSLPAALGVAGVTATVFSPCHRSVHRRLGVEPAPAVSLRLPQPIWVDGEPIPVSYRIVECEGRRLVFVVNDLFYDRPHPYLDTNGMDYADSVARFAYLCRAVLEYGLFTGEIPDVVHGNDWQAALLPVYLKTLYQQPQLRSVRSLLTIHNLGYQGLFPAEQLPATGLGWELFHPEALEFYGRLNLLKGGIVFADAVNTVSPAYAEEIQTDELGKGLHGVIRAHGHKLSGILNGIDVREWDPATDPHLPAHFKPEDRRGKAGCKSALQWRAKLPVRAESFLVGVIGRFDAHKGIHLITDAFPLTADLDVQLVVLGSGDRQIEDRMRALAAAYPERVAVVVGFDEAFAHLIEAGCDAFLMPSAYEPCGLNQMYSHRYGTIPIVRETGGLKDTVIDFSPENLSQDRASGFTFRPFTSEALAGAIRRAELVYRTQPDAWNALVAHVMRLDHSWDRSAREYRALYERLLWR